MVTESEYIDMQHMLEYTGLAEMDSSGDYFNWKNKHVVGTIYSEFIGSWVILTGSMII